MTQPPAGRSSYAWALAVLLGTTVMTSCGAQSGVATPAADRSGALAVQVRADDVYVGLWGDADQKEAVHYLRFRTMNQPTVDCMSRAGFTFEPRFTRQWTDWTPDSTETDAWMGELDRAESTTAVEGDEQPPSKTEPGYDAALDTCLKEAPTPSVSAGSPVGMDELAARYQSILDDVNEKLGSITAYQECMTSHKVDVGSTGETGATALSMYLQSRMPTSRLDESAPSDAWATYRTLENEALASDRACRQAKYFEGLQLLDRPLSAFEEKYQAELSQSEKAWNDVLTQATSDGYQPEAPARRR